MEYSKAAALYRKLVAALPDVELKGDTVPYTALNGHMFSALHKNGTVALRLPDDDREVFEEEARMTRLSPIFAALLALAPALARAQTGTIPPFLYGRFVDDYGSRYAVTPLIWRQGTHTTYWIEKWNAAGQYAIARNDSANPSDGNRYTRIDWVKLDGMAPYTWAYCYSAFKAPTAAAAESVSIAHRDTPKTGCNGFPFSRMRLASTDSERAPLSPGSVPASATIIYATIPDDPHGQGVDPIVAVTTGGQLMQPPAFVDSLTAAADEFALDFYRPGTSIFLLNGGRETGKTAITKRAEFQCGDLASAVREDSALRHATLAANTTRFLDSESHRLLMTAMERRQAIVLARRIARDRGYPTDSLLAMQVINNGGTRVLLLQAIARKDSATLDIAVIADWRNATWSPGLKAITRSTDRDGKDRTEIAFLDALRFGDGPALHIIAEAEGYEGTAYIIYRQHGDFWQKIYTHTAGGC